ncbi:FHA domain-containing protein [Chloroflexota bacterium]
MYKYNCRKCPIRNRCIDESDISPNIKQMLRHAFEARTDTLTTWGRLQRNCLLLIAEEERAKQSAKGSLLSRRLQEARDTKELADKSTPKPDYLKPVSSQKKKSGKLKKKSDKLKPLPSMRPKLKPLPSSQPKLKSLPSSQPKETTAPPPQTESEPTWVASNSSSRTQLGDTPPDIITDSSVPSPQAPRRLQKTPPGRPHWFTVGKSGRHVSLPTDGELILGRFDPSIGVPPDIDLGYEDHDNSVSRRHAKIIGVDGYHTIEDIGGRHGVLINGFRPEPHQQLETGDRISLGRTQLIYDEIPTHILILTPDDRVRHSITVTPTGRQFTIAPPDDIAIGRSDNYVDSVPDIDLGGEGRVANRVSRRHTIITWRNRIPYLEDVGSGFGTRLNGEMLLMGQAVQLKPGDHIWLGGCVLAYDVEL